MSRRVHYVGPSCGRHVDDDPTLGQIVRLVLGSLVAGCGILLVVIGLLAE